VHIKICYPTCSWFNEPPSTTNTKLRHETHQRNNT